MNPDRVGILMRQNDLGEARYCQAKWLPKLSVSYSAKTIVFQLSWAL